MLNFRRLSKQKYDNTNYPLIDTLIEKQRIYPFSSGLSFKYIVLK
jgi:hypothetical protein